MTSESDPSLDAFAPEPTDGDRPDAVSVAALSVATTEARATLDAQIDALTDLDATSFKLLQFTIALLGLVVSGLSVLEPAPRDLVNPSLVLGLTLLVAGALVAVVSYTVNARTVGLGSDGVARAASGASERAVRYALAGSYADWIRFNAAVNRRAGALIGATILLVLGGTLWLLVGLLNVLLGGLPVAVPLAVFALYVATAYATGLHRQLRHLGPPVRPSDVGLETVPAAETFDGQDVFISEQRDDATGYDTDGCTYFQQWSSRDG